MKFDNLIEQLMNDTEQLQLLKALLKSYFDPELQYDETIEAAKKRKKLEEDILAIINS